MNIKLKTYNCPLVDFLSGNNTIKLYNRAELEQIKEMVAEIGLEIRSDWDTIEKNTYFDGYVCLEYNNEQGISYYMDEQDSIDWYGEPPIELKDLY